jgi:hypothetical protein
MHESFHRIQSDLGLPASDRANSHLATADGRIWTRLEWRALAEALLRTGTERKQSLTDALTFRARRQSQFPSAADDERLLELNEGLAEYTGYAMSGLPRAALYDRLAVQLANYEQQDNFSRSFAYASGPAYAILLDASGVAWRKGLNVKSSLTALAAKAYAITHIDPATADSRSLRYTPSRMIADERTREKRRLEREATLRAKFIDGPTLTIPAASAFNYSFDPNGATPLQNAGTVFESSRVTDEWGVLNVSSGSVLMRRVSGPITAVVVSAPAGDNPPLKGDGWELQLNPGWSIRPAEKKGDWVVQRAAAQPEPIARFPFRVESGLVFVDAGINGVPASLTMDTGAPLIFLDEALVHRAGIKVLRSSGGGVNDARIDSLSIGPVVLRNQEIRTRSFGAVNDSASGRPPVVGVIGTSFFRQYVTEFDFANRIITLYDTAAYAYRGPGISVPITFRSELPVVAAKITRDNGDSVIARLIIDIGSATAPVTLTPEFVRAAGLADTRRFIEVAGVTSLYGSGTGRIQRLASVHLGDLNIVRPTVSISDAAGAAIPVGLADGTIGMPVIRRAVMILDYARSRIIFEKNSEFDVRYEFANVSGLQLERVGKSIRVRNVIAGSPAEEIGLRIGDEILEVDNAPVPPSGSVNLPALREPKTTHRLTIRRGRETMSVTIALRRLI